MPARQILLALGLAALLWPARGPAAPGESPRTDTARLADLAAAARQEVVRWQTPAWATARARPSAPMAALLADPRLDLVGITPDGRPRLLLTHNRLAAETVGTDAVWPGGWTGLELDGSGPAGELALWDGGVVRTTHQEFGGRVTVADGQTNVVDHATHVAGTMIAAGLDPDARGMAFAARLDSYFWDQDEAEMAGAAAAGLRVSNHSYGWACGWLYGLGGDPSWYWLGDPAVSEVEDAGFGFYAGGAADWDAIAHAAPRYLIVKSAGNDRDDAGPAPGEGHYVWDGATGGWAWSLVERDPDGGSDGHDTIGYRGTAKNILTVGAVDDIAGGWSAPADVQVSAFTSWGPTDDGRIKPDLVANGVGLLSPVAGADDAYAAFSGTSMAAPGVAGSLHLVRRQYAATMGETPLASTLKAIALHTASEAGPAPGPDYRHGWGLLNTAAAAVLVADQPAAGDRITEGLLTAGATDSYRMHHDGSGELKLTLVWTDPAGTPPAWSLDPPDPVLVHDLELRLERLDDGAVFRPWVLDPADPDAPATTGANGRDNVEQIVATGAGAGFYRVTVSHTGTLIGDQAYSLVQTGLRTVPTSAPQAAVPAAAPVRLRGAAPNPFNPRTEIALSVTRPGPVELAVYDARGRRVATVHDGHLASGEHRLAWDGRTGSGRPAPAGVYLVRLRAGTTADTLRLTLVK